MPALLLTLLFILAIQIYCALRPEEGPPRANAMSMKSRMRALIGLTDTILIFLLVVGGMFLGWFTPTEAASIGVLGILAISVVRRRITWQRLSELPCRKACVTSCMVLFLIAGAVIFGKFLAITRIPFNMASWVASFDLPNLAVMIMIIMIYFACGCVSWTRWP